MSSEQSNLDYCSSIYMLRFSVTSYKKFLAHQERLFEKLFKSYDPGISAIYTLR